MNINLHHLMFNLVSVMLDYLLMEFVQQIWTKTKPTFNTHNQSWYIWTKRAKYLEMRAPCQLFSME